MNKHQQQAIWAGAVHSRPRIIFSLGIRCYRNESAKIIFAVANH